MFNPTPITAENLAADVRKHIPADIELKTNECSVIASRGSTPIVQFDIEGTVLWHTTYELGRWWHHDGTEPADFNEAAEFMVWTIDPQ